KPAPGPPPLPAQNLRAEFAIDGNAGNSSPIKRATAYVTALGCYELQINGHVVDGGDENGLGRPVLAPEWTDYHQRVQYQASEVTGLGKPGNNQIDALLGDGWYAGRLGLSQIVPNGPIRAIYGRRPRLLCQIEIERTDGTRQTVASDEFWW